MKLSTLLHSIDIKAIDRDAEISNVTDRANTAASGSIFVCICGARADGHDFAPTAYQNGCRVFVCSRSLSLPDDAIICTVQDTRSALAKLACAFYGNPSKQLKIIGITGTKGKTTVASLLSQVLDRSGIPCGYIGTNGISYNGASKPLQNTTPDPLTLQRVLREMTDSGMHAVVLEVSSQAIYQSRIVGMEFEACVFTNLYSDHVGPTEHPSFEHYKSCKHRLFTDFPSKFMICNADDPYTDEMKTGRSAERLITYSLKDDRADYFAQNILPTLNQNGYGISFLIQKDQKNYPISLPLLGKFNAGNALAVLAVAKECFDLSIYTVKDVLADAKVTGRTETVQLGRGACAVIDYAHNGESLSKLLTALREYKPKRLICLFGSVGERSFLRRREMGDAAARLCDLAILTSDNPGREDPMKIINEIAQPFQSTKTPYFAIPDRAQAIREAVRLTGDNNILVLAGKGHEDYQLIGTETVPFSDREILLNEISLNEKE